MRKPVRPVFIVMLIFAIAAAIIGSSGLLTPREIVPWRQDFGAAVAEARASDKPLLLDFSAEWCEPCQQMRHTTWASAKVARALESYVPVHIEIDDHPDLAARFGINPIPAMVIIDADGTIKNYTDGYYDADAFLAWLKSKPMRPPVRTSDELPSLPP